MTAPVPRLVPAAPVDRWLFPGGTRLPVVRGGSDAPPPPPPPPAPPPPAADPPPPAPAPGPDPNKTFTQAELDKIVQERVARAKGAPPADYAELQAKAKQLAEIEEAAKTETQKLAERAERAEKDRDAALAAAKRSLAQAAVIAAARAAADPGDVYALLPKDAATGVPTGVAIGDDGRITGAEEAVKALLAAKPHLVGTRQAGSADGGARTDAQGRATTLQEAAEKRLAKT